MSTTWRRTRERPEYCERLCWIRAELVARFCSSLTSQLGTEKTTLDDLTKYHLEFFKSFPEKENRATGALFMLNNGAAIHLLEAPTKVLFALLRALRKDGSNSSGGTGSAPSPPPVLKNARICSFSEEVPREYKVWAARQLKVPDEEEFQPPKDWLKAAFTLLKSFLELGREVQSMSDEKAVDYLQKNESKQFMARVPSVQHVLAYAQCDEICAIDEFLGIYDKRIDFILGAVLSLVCQLRCSLLFAIPESEKVWPVEPFLKVSACISKQNLLTCRRLCFAVLM